MPDAYGFEHLGQEVRCIVPDCGAGGPMWEWRDHERAIHHEHHEHERELKRSRESRERLAEYRRAQAEERELRERMGL